ncbi:Uncharacterised protein [Serratia fonticola]|uniref:Uncharacterized protein n=1 Tax=Serratia fonticola TaxID=47917 RepID=A0A3S5F2I6_SERFO|nr:Uncharacterised protein [Serratia fonticola]
MECAPELLKCITAFLKLANIIALCVHQHLRNKTTKK